MTFSSFQLGLILLASFATTGSATLSIRALPNGILHLNAPAVTFHSIVVTQDCLKTMLRNCTNFDIPLSLPSTGNIQSTRDALILRSPTDTIMLNELDLTKTLAHLLNSSSEKCSFYGEMDAWNKTRVQTLQIGKQTNDLQIMATDVKIGNSSLLKAMNVKCNYINRLQTESCNGNACPVSRVDNVTSYPHGVA